MMEYRLIGFEDRFVLDRISIPETGFPSRFSTAGIW